MFCDLVRGVVKDTAVANVKYSLSATGKPLNILLMVLIGWKSNHIWLKYLIDILCRGFCFEIPSIWP